MASITVVYVNRETNCPAARQVFIGRDIEEASVLAANYQSRHPELKDVKFEVKR
jgi:hypothetical protein